VARAADSPGGAHEGSLPVNTVVHFQQFLLLQEEPRVAMPNRAIKVIFFMSVSCIGISSEACILLQEPYILIIFAVGTGIAPGSGPKNRDNYPEISFLVWFYPLPLHSLAKGQIKYSYETYISTAHKAS
jgi:hypothetical protein